MRKKYVIPLILTLICTILVSCSNNEEKNYDAKKLSDYLNNINTIDTISIGGHLNSSLKLINNITPFKTAEEVDNFKTLPCSYISNDKLYIIRNFPDDITGDINEYISSGQTIREIEVYSISNIADSPSIITLKSIENRKLIYYSLYYDSAAETFRILGTENNKGDFKQYLWTFDINGNLQSELVIPGVDLFSAVIHRENIYYINQADHGFYQYDLKKSNSNIISSETSVFFSSDNNIYYIKEDVDDNFNAKKSLYLYENEKSKKILDIAVDISIFNASYDSGNKLLYLSNGTNIYVYSDQTQKIDMIFESYGEYLNILQIAGNVINISNGNHQMSLFELSTTPQAINNQATELKICYVTSQAGQAKLTYDTSIKNMKAAGFPVNLNDGYISDSYSEYANTMAKKLLAGDDDFDLFYVDNTMLQLLKEQYYLDLSAYPLLNDKYNKMYDGIKDLSSIDGKLCLVPLFIKFTALNANLSLVDNIVDIPENLDGFIVARDEIKNSFSDDSTTFMSDSYAHNLVLPLFEQYMANFMNKNDAADEAALKQLIENTVVLLNDNSVAVGAHNRNCYLNFTQIFSSSFEDDINHKTVQIPKINGNFKYAAEVNYIAINPNSKNKELSAAFIANVIDDYSDMGVVELYQANEGSLYDLMLSDCVRSCRETEFTMLIAEQVDGLMRKTITVDEMTDTVYNFLKMTRDE